MTSPADFVPSEDDPLENHIVGHVFSVTLWFQVDDDGFWADPRFCVYARKPDGQVQGIDVDTTMMWSDCDVCLEVDFTVMVGSSGWLGCFCFSTDYEIAQVSLEQLNKSTVRREVYLR